MMKKKSYESLKRIRKRKKKRKKKEKMLKRKVQTLWLLLFECFSN